MTAPPPKPASVSRSRRSVILTCVGVAILLLACRGESDSSFTDSKANRQEALLLAQAYAEQHRPQLLAEDRGTIGEGKVNGGSLRGRSKRAFEVSLAITGAARVKEIVVYVYDSDGLAVAGAQSRDKYGAIVHTIGGKLDRKFRSRD